MEIIYQLIQNTYISMTVLLVVALGGLLAERSGVTNIALEGIMVLGAFVGIWSIQGLEGFPYSPLTEMVIFIVALSFSVIILLIAHILLVKIGKLDLYKFKDPEMQISSESVNGFKIFSFLIPLLGIFWFFKLKVRRPKAAITSIKFAITGVIAYMMAFGIQQVMIGIEARTQFILIMGLMIGGIVGGLYAMIHAHASIFMKADQIISATALNLFAPAFAIFTARFIQGGQQVQFNSTFMIQEVPILGTIPIIGDLFFSRVFLSFYIGLGLLVVIGFLLFRSKFGLRLRACGENPHAADSLGINIYRMRFIAVTLSGVLAGMGGVIFVTSTSTEFNVTVAGFGFLAIAVLIFGNWKPSGIILAALFFGFMRTIANSYSIIPFLTNLGIEKEIYDIVPYVATLVILAAFSKSSRSPKALGQIYDQGKR
ncbi:MAG: ABC transporter permease [Acholeplasmataceae bacterium]|nr:ABC transporter permease [Acholeplasmataceae bacterium]